MSINAKYSLLAMLFSAWAGVAVFAQPVPALDFVTVGSAGNRGTLASERALAADAHTPFGAVAYEFRITRTEVLVEQWWEFIEAYRPYSMGERGSRFTSTWIGRDIGSDRFARPVFAARYPADVAWEYAARYCNWLHNDKQSELWAFESGAYDISTFTYNADGTGNHQRTRSLGARFWIPSYDELFKSFFYDPNRYGEGQEGYWEFSNRSNVPFVSGAVTSGGTTNAGMGWPNYESGQYPFAQSYFGLLDTSGGLTEWSETAVIGDGGRRYGRGSDVINNADVIDQIDSIVAEYASTDVFVGGIGFRVATVPTPSAIVMCCVCMCVGVTRRTRWLKSKP